MPLFFMRGARVHCLEMGSLHWGFWLALCLLRCASLGLCGARDWCEGEGQVGMRYPLFLSLGKRSNNHKQVMMTTGCFRGVAVMCLIQQPRFRQLLCPRAQGNDTSYTQTRTHETWAHVNAHTHPPTMYNFHNVATFYHGKSCTWDRFPCCSISPSAHHGRVPSRTRRAPPHLGPASHGGPFLASPAEEEEGKHSKNTLLAQSITRLI